jgi:mono/diheme cytochrome c family protein
MTHRRRCRFVLVYVAAVCAAVAGTAGAEESKIWAGAYSPGQAEQGKKLFESNCSTCHKSDLSGDRGPALKGDHFFATWEAGSVNRLFTKIKETMPRNRGTTSLSEEDYLAIVAYILQANGFPAGKDGVELAADALDDIPILKKGQEGGKGIANFALVQVVGCLTRDRGDEWRLVSATEPALTKDQPAAPQELKDDAAKPLGANAFVLRSVARFKPEAYRGQKMEARGLIYRSPEHSALSLTSLQVVDSKCAD